jgi:uncharacterized protein
MSQVGSSRVQIVEYPGARISKPNILVGLPEAGLVGSIAASYLAEMLRLPEIGYIDSELEPPLLVVEKSVPRYPIRIFGQDDLVIVVCDIPLTPRLATEFSNALMNWAISKHSRLVIGATGLPSKNRLEQKEEVPSVFFAGTAGKDTVASVSKVAQTLEEAIIVGTYSLILKRCMALNQPNITLFAESHLDFPDPGAAAAVINVLNVLLHVSVDIKPLLEESEQVRLRSRELMKRTQQSMQQMSQGAPELYA